MSVNLGNAEASITLNISKFESAYNQVVSQTKGLGSKLKNAVKGVSLDGLGESAGKLSEKLSGVSKASAGLLTGIAATVPATQELRRDMSMLEQNAKNAGVSMNVTEQAFKTFNAVSGETDSSIEGISNLLQAGFTESNLQIAVEGLSGAAQRFPDTLKIESLSDSLQETIATGKSIGQFGELLDRMGIGAENFDKQLAKCKTSAERQDLALRTLAKAGLTDSYKQWEKNNKELIDYENSTYEMQKALGELAKTVAPVVTSFANLGIKGLNAFNSLPEPIKNVSLGFVGLVAASSPALGIFSKLIENKKNLTTVTSGLYKVLIANPYGLVAVAAGALAVAIAEVVRTSNAETKAAQAASKEREKAVASVETQTQKNQFYAKQLETLMGVENKSGSQKQQIKRYVDLLNESVEGLNLTYNEEKDKLNQTTDAINKKIEAQKKAALAEVYIKNSKDALEDYANSSLKLKEAQNELAKAEEKWAEGRVKNRAGINTNSRELTTLKNKVRDLSNATLTAMEDMNKYANESAKVSGAWKKLTQDAKKAGVQIPQSLKEGFDSGKYAIPATVDELQALIKFDKAAQRAGEAGQDMVNQLRVQIQNGEISVQQAAEMLGSKFPAGIRSKKGETRQAGREVAQAGKDGANEVNYTQTGSNKSTQLKGGISSGISAVAKAAKAVSQEGKKSAGSVDYTPTGKEKSTQMGSGMKKNKGQTVKAARDVMTEGRTSARNVDYTSAGTNKSTQMGSGIRKNKSSVTSAAKGVVESGRTAAKGVSFASVGSNIASGIASGINAGVGFVKSAVSGIINAAKSTAKKLAQIFSPSRLFKKEVGIPITQGVAVGMVDAIPEVEKASKETIKRANAVMASSNIDIPNIRTQDSSYSQCQSGNLGSNVYEGNATYNFYSPVKLTPMEAVNQMKKARRDMALGF